MNELKPVILVSDTSVEKKLIITIDLFHIIFKAKLSSGGLKY